LFVLLPHAPMIVNAELNETFADAVTPGMPAEVVRDGEGPSQRWHAHAARGRMIGARSSTTMHRMRASTPSPACWPSMPCRESMRASASACWWSLVLPRQDRESRLKRPAPTLSVPFPGQRRDPPHRFHPRR
jgi:hypothetical protein